jgi:hypothetical protein
VNLIKDMFGGYEPDFPDHPPADATVESLWADLIKVRKELHASKRLKRGVKPKAEDAAKLLLCDMRLSQIPIPMIAEIIRGVFKSYGIESKCSESSVRWYQSQYGLDWPIVRRTLPPIRINNDTQ